MADCTPYTVSAIDGDGDEIALPSPPPLLSPVDLPGGNAGTYPITLIPSAAGEFTRIYRVMLSTDADTVINFTDGGTSLPCKVPLVAGEQLVLDPGIFPYWQGTNGKDFKLNSSNAAANITGGVWGFQNDA